MQANEVVRSRGVCAMKMDSQQLIQVAANWLVPMFDVDRQLFCHRRHGAAGMVTEGLSHRYTVMTLLGLHRLEGSGVRSPIEIRPALESLLSQYTWIGNVGDIGLLLWLISLAAPDRLCEVYSSLHVESALTRYRDGREARTMELAWLLSGLAHATAVQGAKLVDCEGLSMTVYKLLAKNQGAHGFFGHQAVWKSVSGILRGRIGSFADQVYPIYALTRFAEAHKVHAALEMARICAESICREQGPLGQWWWHFDVVSGKVFQKYPVYSVHQDGMAPMALFALGDAMQVDLSEPIYKGLSWIYGNNELGVDMRDKSSRVIWRNVHRKDRQLRFNESRDVVWSDDNGASVGNLRILSECRPYELGWLLYAFAGR